MAIKNKVPYPAAHIFYIFHPTHRQITCQIGTCYKTPCFPPCFLTCVNSLCFMLVSDFSWHPDFQSSPQKSALGWIVWGSKILNRFDDCGSREDVSYSPTKHFYKFIFPVARFFSVNVFTPFAFKYISLFFLYGSHLSFFKWLLQENNVLINSIKETCLTGEK